LALEFEENSERPLNLFLFLYEETMFQQRFLVAMFLFTAVTFIILIELFNFDSYKLPSRFEE
jgi:hypothetical protein